MRRLFPVILLCSLAFGQGGVIGPKAVIGPKGVVYRGATGGANTFALVQSQSATCATTTSCAVSLPGNTTAGNLVMFALMWGASSGTITQCDGGSCSTTCTTSTDSFNTLPSNPISDTVSDELDVVYAKMSTALTSFTFCIAGGGSHTIRVAAYEYSASSGFPALASVLDTSNVGNGGGSQVLTGTGGNITPATAGELVFSAIQMESTISAFVITGTGYSEQPTSNGTAGNGWLGTDRGDGCHNLSSVNTATTCTFSWTTAASYSATIAAFKHN